jgi:hypothetical protein
MRDLWDIDAEAEAEAAELERFDADLLLAGMNALGDAIHAARARGVCCHQSAQGHQAGQADGLRPGQVRCTDGCGRVFDGDEAWWAAMDEAVTGDA